MRRPQSQRENAQDSDVRDNYARAWDLLFGWVGILIGVILLLVADKLKPEHPIGGALSAEFGSILVGIGIVHTAYEKVLRKHYKDDVLEAVQKTLRYNLKGYSDFKAAGVIAYHPNLPLDHICGVMEKSRRVKMLKTFFQESLVENALRKVLQSSTESTVDLFLSDPNSPVLDARSKVLNRNDRDLARRRVIEEVEMISELALPPNDKRVTVTIYNGWPGAPLIQCDQRIYVGLYLRAKRSFDGPWVEVQVPVDMDGPDCLGKLLASEFESFKGDSTVLRDPNDFAVWLRDHPIDRLPRAV